MPAESLRLKVAALSTWNCKSRGMIAVIAAAFLLCCSVCTAQDLHSLPYPLQQDPLASSYYPVWKKAFQSLNNLEDTEFDAHIRISKIFNYGELRDRDFMTVEYFVSSGWFLCRQIVTFDIMLPSDDPSFTQFPREIYLSEEELSLLLQTGGAKVVGAARVKAPLAFTTRELALDQLKQMVGEASFDEGKVAMDLVDGEPTLSVTATIDYEQNTCRQGILNLVSGKFSVTDSACYTVN